MMRKFILFLFSHGIVFVGGIALGIYLLPILTAPDSPDAAKLQAEASKAIYQAEFKKDLKGSDFLHWGEGKVSLSASQVVHEGSLAPGPDYKLYLTKTLVDDEASFLQIKDQSVRIGDIKTFNGFLVDIPQGVDIEQYSAVLVWCETFGEFITAAQYK